MINGQANTKYQSKLNNVLDSVAEGSFEHILHLSPHLPVHYRNREVRGAHKNVKSRCKNNHTYMHSDIVQLAYKLWGQVWVIGDMSIHFLVC